MIFVPFADSGRFVRSILSKIIAFDQLTVRPLLYRQHLHVCPYSCTIRKKPFLQEESPYAAQMVARQNRVSDLPQELLRLERRRDRRPAGRDLEARLPAGARRGDRLALPRLPLAHGRPGLRHLRLLRHRPALRHHGRHGRADREGARARDLHRDGSGRQPLLGRA